MWNQWSSASTVHSMQIPALSLNTPPPQPSLPPPLPDAPPPPPPAENVVPASPTAYVSVQQSSTVPPLTSAISSASSNSPYEQYTAGQYAAMTPEQQFALQQHWQQWQTYQQEYAKWHVQYGEQYKREMEAAAAAVSAPVAYQPLPQSQGYFVPTEAAASVAQSVQPTAKIMAHPQMYNRPPPPPPPAQPHTPHSQAYQLQPSLPWQQQTQPARYGQTPTSYNQSSDFANSKETLCSQFPNIRQPPPTIGKAAPGSNQAFSMNSIESKNQRSTQFVSEDRRADNNKESFKESPPFKAIGRCEVSSVNTYNSVVKPLSNSINNNVREAQDKEKDAQHTYIPNRIKGNSRKGNSTNVNKQNWLHDNGGHNSHYAPSDNNSLTGPKNLNNPFNSFDNKSFNTVELDISEHSNSNNKANFGNNSDGSKNLLDKINSGSGSGNSGIYTNDLESKYFKKPSQYFNFGNTGARRIDSNYGIGLNNLEYSPGMGQANDSANRCGGNSGRWENSAQNNMQQFAPNSSNNFKRTAGFGCQGPQNHRNLGIVHQHQKRGLDLDEESFDRLFNQWEKQFEEWKRANANHPDRDKYRRYEEEFEKQRRHISERSEQMRRRRQLLNPQPQNDSAGDYGDYDGKDEYNNEEKFDQQERLTSQQRLFDGGSKTQQKQQVDQEYCAQNQSGKQNPTKQLEGVKKTRIGSQTGQRTLHGHQIKVACDPLASDQPETPKLQEPSERQTQQKHIQLLQKTQDIQVLPVTSKIAKEINKSHIIQGDTKMSQNQLHKPIDVFQPKELDESVEPGNNAKAATSLGKRRANVDTLRDTSIKHTKKENIEIISLDDDDENLSREKTETTSSNERHITNLFEKSEGIPGLDLVDSCKDSGQSRSPESPIATSPAVKKDESKKIPSLFDIVICKPNSSPTRENSRQSAGTVSTNNTSDLVDQLKTSKMSSLPTDTTLHNPGMLALQSQNRDQSRLNMKSTEQFVDPLPNFLQKLQNQMPQEQQFQTNNDSDARPLSFAEWQRKKRKANCSDTDVSSSSCSPSFGNNCDKNVEPGQKARVGYGFDGDFRSNDSPNIGQGPNATNFSLQDVNFGSNRLNFGPDGPCLGPNGPNCGPNESNFRHDFVANFRPRAPSSSLAPQNRDSCNAFPRNCGTGNGPRLGSGYNSFGENPFRRLSGPQAPRFTSTGCGPYLNNISASHGGNRNSGLGRNNFKFMDSSAKMSVNPNVLVEPDNVYRPMQVFDYQNRTTAPKVIDYGHKSVDGSLDGTALAMPDFKPVNMFDYGHASRNMSTEQVDETGIINRFSNVKKKNRKRNKNRQQRSQPQLLSQQQVSNPPSEGEHEKKSESENIEAKTIKVDELDKSEGLEEISEGEDEALADMMQPDSIVPPRIDGSAQQKDNQIKQLAKAFPANPQRRILGQDPPIALFPSTAVANNQIRSNNDAQHLEISIPTNENRNTISINEVLLPPGRLTRPKKICVILRGPPGSGKSHVAKLIKEKELEMGGSNLRILSIDDYFIIENDYEEKCQKTGKMIPKKEILYEYDDTMEETYMQYLIKSFKKTLTDNLYDFIIVDCNNSSLRTLNEFYCNAKDAGFVPYIVDLHCNLETCLSRDNHQRSERDIREVLNNWCATPFHYIKLDVSRLLENVIEMEDIENMATDDNAGSGAADNSLGLKISTDTKLLESMNELEEDSNSADATVDCGFLKSKWENDTTEENLERLDGTNRLIQKRKAASISDYLQLDDWEPPSRSVNGKKRVRWADIEEDRAQKKMRAIGFVVGQTDWKRMMDPNAGNRALNKTKYIERVNKRR